MKIGDETFIIAALMAMRHPKSIVLSGALSALVVMTVRHTAAAFVASTSLLGKILVSRFSSLD
jgi:putative Ca2+/H+ antiporter (TMEM165/GDT1 family)